MQLNHKDVFVKLDSTSVCTLIYQSMSQLTISWSSNDRSPVASLLLNALRGSEQSDVTFNKTVQPGNEIK